MIPQPTRPETGGHSKEHQRRFDTWFRLVERQIRREHSRAHSRHKMRHDCKTIRLVCDRNGDLAGLIRGADEGNRTPVFSLGS